jgi:N-acetylglucosaminyldiphosphoundecaprenol N-acetyl-beta-D-mannosaminyltransferase
MKAVLAQPGLSHFLLGGTPDVLADLERRIGERYAAAHVAGRLAPPFGDPTEEDLDEYALQIRASGADIVWVGLGTPRQDIVISRLVGRVDAVLVGVGAAFDFLSGRKSEAPEFLHRTGLEWTYRLASEPRRLWRRYLIGNTLFIAAALRQLPEARRRSYGGTSHSPVCGEGMSLEQRVTAAYPRVAVGGASVHCIDEAAAIETLVDAAVRGNRPWLVVTPNIQHVALLETDAQLRDCFARADLVLADGWPVVKAVRMLGGARVQRITGADLFPALCERAAARQLRIGIVGGMDGAAAAAAGALRRRFPGLQVVLTLEPPWGFESDGHRLRDVLATVREAELDILFLALGTPKQENFAARHLDEMAAGVTLCVGAAVDFVAGRQRRAPYVLRRFGLEWAYRAVHQPRRLIPRYARSAPVFARVVLRDRARSRPR